MDPFFLDILIADLGGSNEETTTVSCTATDLNNLVFGTAEGDLLLFQKVQCVLTLRRKKKLSKLPIQQIAMIRNIVIVLFDRSLAFLDNQTLDPLRGFNLLKQVDSFDSTETHLLITKENKVILYNLQERIEFIDSLALDHIPLSICHSMNSSVFSHEFGYGMISWNNKNIFELCPHETSIGLPSICKLDRQFFLLSSDGEHDFGITLSEQGDPASNNILFEATPKVIAYQRPYILSLEGSFIRVYSLFDQKIQQVMPLPMNNPLTLYSWNRNVILVCNQTVFEIRMLPIAIQIDRLLEFGLVEQVIDLTLSEEFKQLEENERNECMSKIGFKFLEQGLFTDAFQFFSKSEVSVKKISEIFFSSDFDQIIQINAPEDSALKSEFTKNAYRECMIFLEKRAPKDTETYDSLFKLYFYLSLDQKIEMIAKKVSVSQCLTFLQNQSMDTLLLQSHLCQLNGMHSEMIAIWKQMPVSDFMLTFFQNCEAKILIENIDWIFQAFPSPLSLFKREDITEYDLVLKYLQEKIEYLEYIVQLPDNETYHQVLLNEYLQNSNSQSLSSELKKIKFSFEKSLIEYISEADPQMMKIVKFIQDKHSSYDSEEALKATKDLIIEHIAVARRLEDFDTVSRMLLEEYGDLKGAAQCCSCIKNEVERQNSFFRIFSSELNKNPHDALKLLCLYPTEFDVNQIVDSLPCDIKLDRIVDYLIEVMKVSNKHEMILCGIYKLRLANLEMESTQAKTRSIRITDSTICCECDEQISDSIFYLKPDESVCHYNCMP